MVTTLFSSVQIIILKKKKEKKEKGETWIGCVIRGGAGKIYLQVLSRVVDKDKDQRLFYRQ